MHISQKIRHPPAGRTGQAYEGVCKRFIQVRFDNFKENDRKRNEITTTG